VNNHALYVAAADCIRDEVERVARQTGTDRPLLEDYFEFHHVIPRCMDGMDDPTNLVELLPEEHRIAHLLLAKIYPHNSDLRYAAFSDDNGGTLSWSV
jgi:hypothetical protein